MKLITDLLPHLFLYSFLAVIGLTLFLAILGLVSIPFHWVASKLNQTRCPQCRDFFKSKLVDWEIIDEREVLRTVNRVDQGTIYSNSIFEPNHAIAINRREQVTFVEKTIRNYWVCNDLDCGHQWQTEEVSEYEGSLEN